MPWLKETFTSQACTAPLEVLLPASAGPWPAVLLLHGTFGLLPEYRADMAGFAQALADAGVAVAMPHYFEACLPATEAGVAAMALIAERRSAWIVACGDALAQVAQDTRFSGARLGLLGFSLGGHLALSVALDPPPHAWLNGVVDFFGPTSGLGPSFARLPAVLVCHGSADAIVSPRDSQQLVEALKREGRKQGVGYEYEVFSGEGHGFKDAALRRSRELTVEFLKKHL